MVIILLAAGIVFAGVLTLRKPVELDHAGQGPAGSLAWPKLRVDINTAGVAELNLLPGVGRTLAERIVEDRDLRGPFPDVDALMRVRGIGRATVDRLRELAAAVPLAPDAPHKPGAARKFTADSADLR